MAMSEAPPNIISIPTRRPNAQTSVPALKRIPQQYSAGDHRHECREQRPSKSRSLPRSQCDNEPHDPCNEEQPSQKDGGEETCDQRDNDRGKSKDAQGDPLG
jgi:hypothetical protein